MLSHLCTETVAPAPRIIKLAMRIVRGSKLKPRDAVHLACAETARCDYFLTCDDTLIRTVKRKRSLPKLRVEAINPVEFIRREGEEHGES